MKHAESLGWTERHSVSRWGFKILKSGGTGARRSNEIDTHTPRKTHFKNHTGTHAHKHARCARENRRWPPQPYVCRPRATEPTLSRSLSPKSAPERWCTLATHFLAHSPPPPTIFLCVPSWRGARRHRFSLHLFLTFVFSSLSLSSLLCWSLFRLAPHHPSTCLVQNADLAQHLGQLQRPPTTSLSRRNLALALAGSRPTHDSLPTILSSPSLGNSLQALLQRPPRLSWPTCCLTLHLCSLFRTSTSSRLYNR